MHHTVRERLLEGDYSGSYLYRTANIYIKESVLLFWINTISPTAEFFANLPHKEQLQAIKINDWYFKSKSLHCYKDEPPRTKEEGADLFFSPIVEMVMGDLLRLYIRKAGYDDAKLYKASRKDDKSGADYILKLSHGWDIAIDIAITKKKDYISQKKELENRRIVCKEFNGIFQREKKQRMNKRVLVLDPKFAFYFMKEYMRSVSHMSDHDLESDVFEKNMDRVTEQSYNSVKFHQIQEDVISSVQERIKTILIEVEMWVALKRARAEEKARRRFSESTSLFQNDFLIENPDRENIVQDAV